MTEAKTFKYRTENGEDTLYTLERWAFEDAAEEIAEYLESVEAEYPDERVIEIWDETRQAWREFHVDCDQIRTYSAMEVTK